MRQEPIFQENPIGCATITYICIYMYMGGRCYVPPGMTSGTLCFRVVRPSVRPSCFRDTTLCAAPSKNYAFSTNYHACFAMPT